jgi:hypothetical protein
MKFIFKQEHCVNQSSNKTNVWISLLLQTWKSAQICESIFKQEHGVPHEIWLDIVNGTANQICCMNRRDIICCQAEAAQVENLIANFLILFLLQGSTQ